MLVRVAGVLRALAWALSALRNLLIVTADVIESLGLNQDIDTLLWISLIFCLATRRFKTLGTVVAIIIFVSPTGKVVQQAWNIASDTLEDPE